MEIKLKYPDAEVDLNVYVKKSYNIQVAKLRKEERILNTLTSPINYLKISVPAFIIGYTFYTQYKSYSDVFNIFGIGLMIIGSVLLPAGFFTKEIKKLLGSILLKSMPKVESLKQYKHKLLTQLVLQEKKYQYADEYFQECGYSNETIPIDDFSNLIQGMSEEGIMKMISNKEANKVEAVRNLKKYLFSDIRFSAFIESISLVPTLCQPIKEILSSSESVQIGWPINNRWENENIIIKPKN